MKKNVNRMRFFEKSSMTRFEMIVLSELKFRNKNHSKSSKSQNLIVPKFIHQQDNDKISLKRNEMLEDLV
jgi:hypothetical protein